jgi:hypothetical protein
MAHPSRPRPTRTGSSGPRSRTSERPPSAPARTPRSTPPRHQVITKDAGMARLPGIRLFYAVLLLDRSSEEASKHPQLHWLKIVAVNVLGGRRRKASRAEVSPSRLNRARSRPNLSPVHRAVRPTCFIGVNHIDRVTAIACGDRTITHASRFGDRSDTGGPYSAGNRFLSGKQDSRSPVRQAGIRSVGA